MENFSLLVEILLGTSAIIVAIRNIYSMVSQPRKMLKKHQEEQQEELIKTIKTVIKEEIGGVELGLEYHDKTLRLILASQIERIYWSGFKTKTLYLYNQEPLHTLYEAYHSLGGNGHISNLCEQMKTWTVVDSEDRVANQ